MKKSQLVTIKVNKMEKKQSRLYEQIEKNRQLKSKIDEEIKI